METQRLGRYEIVEECGRGAMGVVYKAHDPKIGRHVAVKIIQVEAGARDKGFAERFKKELEIAGSLSHLNIVRVYDAGEWKGVSYFTMEFVEGMTLAELLRDQGPFPCLQSLRIVSQIADALAYAHGQGVIHRDIKSQNILIDREGAPKLTDFGLARLSSAERTLTGLVVGTPKYSSPEQLRGNAVDERSDIFSLGVVLYEVLTSANPFVGETMTEIVGKIQTLTPPPPSAVIKDIPPAVDRLVLKAMAKEPEARYQRADELREDIERVMKQPADGDITIPGQIARKEGTKPALWKRPATIGLVVFFLVVAIIVGLWVIPDGQGPKEATADAIYRQGYDDLQTGRIEEAERRFRELLARGDYEDRGLEGLAKLALYQGEEGQTLELGKKAIQLNPSNMYAHALLGTVHFRRGDLDRALEYYRKSESLTPGLIWQQAEATNMTGRVLSARGEKEQALRYYHQAIEQDPTFKPAYDNLGALLASMDRSNESIEVYQKLLRMDPGNTKALALLDQQKRYLGFRQEKEKQDWLRRWIDEFDQEIKERRSRKEPILDRSVDRPWTSRPLTLAFYDIEEKGTPPEREGESIFLHLGIIEGLNKSGRVAIVDREEFAVFLQELELSQTELADPERALAIGRVFGAQTVMTGVLARYKEEVTVMLKGMEVETTLVKFTMSEDRKAGEGISDYSKRIAKSLLDEISQAYPLRGVIQKVGEERIWINIGRFVGVQPGMRFHVLKPQAEDPHMNLQVERERIGMIEVVEASKTAAIGRVLEGSIQPSVGEYIEEGRLEGGDS